MTSSEVGTATLDELLAEADRHPGAAALAKDLRDWGETIHVDVAGKAFARLQGWLERHLGDPETGEADRLLAALEASKTKNGLNLTTAWTGGWILNCADGPMARGATARETLRAAFPSRPSAEPAP